MAEEPQVNDLREVRSVGSAGAGHLFHLIRSGQATTRPALAAATGLARSTISQRVDALVSEGLVVEAGEAPSSGGRPPTMLAFNKRAGVVLVADLGASRCRLALLDLDAAILKELASELDIGMGPDLVIDWVSDRFDALLAEAGHRGSDVRAIGIGVPGPVEFAVGRVVAPPIMPGWDGVVIPDLFAERFPGIPILVDNDVNIMALGDYWAGDRGEPRDLLFVKVGTGIGSGIIVGGRIHRGAQGTAGDIGHIAMAEHGDVTCRCGNRGCVEAIASGAALARRLTDLGIPAATSRDVFKLVRAGNTTATRLVRDAGRMLGEVLAGIVNFLNPAAIVIGGDVAEADEQLLAGVREVVYRRSTTLATRYLEIRHSTLNDHAGITGAAVMVLDHLLSPEAVDRQIDSRSTADGQVELGDRLAGRGKASAIMSASAEEG